ncbi:mannose-ethanolamine phosphotransferase gpi13 [Chytriomyces hyalinus]|nr:mannose-ethanolamine phosphotransferase gpi13 [Chytriomyces hyalinus]
MKRRNVKSDTNATTSGAQTEAGVTKIGHAKEKFGLICAVLLAILLLQAGAVTLFGAGFLLSRIELPNVTPSSTLHPPRFKRAVIVLIDALRFDFTHWDESITEADAPYYKNKLPILHDKLLNEPANSLLFRVRADPPTTTMQRLKALVTGTLPTFVDAGSNFGSSSISEDNLISQLVSHGRRLLFMGDDTWIGLFPSQFDEYHPFPSFNVQDLHTVDNGCVEHLFPALDNTTADWNFVVAHFLGVDHVGHSFGPSTLPMQEKLTQVNEWLERVFQSVDNETVVVVLGDHGMDPKGDHGGDSENEVNAGLFLFSKSNLWQGPSKPESDLNKLLGSLESLEASIGEPYVSLDKIRTMPQIDLVPTLSALLGVPIPFGNLGSIVPELFFVPLQDAQTGSVIKTGEENLLSVTRSNAVQVHNYLSEYSNQRMAADFSLEHLTVMFQEAEASYAVFTARRAAASSSKLTTQDALDLQLIYIQYMKFMRQSLKAARRVWARFDVPLILLGIFSFLGSIVLSGWAIYVWWTNGGNYSMLSVVALGISGLVGVVIAPMTGIVDNFIKILPSDTVASVLTPTHERIFLGSVFAVLGFILASLPNVLSSNASPIRKAFNARTGPQWVLTILLLAAWVGVPASDSFTIYEESVTLHLLQTFGLCTFIASLSVSENERRSKLLWRSISFMVLNRFMSLSTICREEKAQTCYPTFNSDPNSSVASPTAVLGLLAMIPITLATLRSALIRSDSLHSTGAFLVTWLLPIGTSVSFIYWLLDTMQGYQQFVGPWAWLIPLKVWWAKMGFLASGNVSLFVWATEATCLGVTTVTKKEELLGDGAQTRYKVLLGLQNPLGSTYLAFLGCVYLVLGMFQKPMGGLMLGVQFVQIVGIVEMFALLRSDGVSEKSRNDSDAAEDLHSFSEQIEVEKNAAAAPLSLTALFTVVLLILGQQSYFATGHQFTMSSIQWEVSFVGLFEVSWIWSPVMMNLNTFGGPLLSLMALPLLGTWKRRVSGGILEQMVVQEVGTVFLIGSACLGLWGFSATALAGHFRRHLMVWSVYAPKFLGVAVGMISLQAHLILFGVGAVFLAWNSYREIFGVVVDRGF